MPVSADELSARLTMVNVRFTMFALAIMICIANMVYAWYMYNSQESLVTRNHRRVRNTALGLATANIVLAAVGLLLLFSRMMSSAGEVRKTSGSIAVFITALLLGCNAALLFVVHANYKIRLDGRLEQRQRTVQGAVTGVTAFSALFVLVAFALMLAGSAQRL